MGDLSEHFSMREFACKCCGVSRVDPDLLMGLEELRRIAGAPIVINDGFRCGKHNAAVGGVGHSEHTQARAADFEIPGLTLAEMYALAERVPQFRNGGIGIYDQRFLHVDVRGYVARWARVKGVYTSIERSGLLA